MNQFNKEMQPYFDDLEYKETQSQLNDFSKFVQFLSIYYQDELQAINQNYARKYPMKKDIIQNCRKKRLDELAMKCFLRPH